MKEIFAFDVMRMATMAMQNSNTISIYWEIVKEFRLQTQKMVDLGTEYKIHCFAPGAVAGD